ncbi:MAG: SpoVR family protein [Deltaproteobacteria bacterium]|nr:SpoVR family protein [Deltaproteobacteria bacterium]
MPRVWDVSDLEGWDERIRARVEAEGLDCYPQEFELCDHNQMLAYMAYSGMPSHYPHWSYGKSFEKLKTLYDHGVSGLPYEMVINSNPALAYLMRDNSLLLQILTIAHVYGHNDFFKNNFTFRSTRAEYTIPTYKAHAQRVRAYQEDPSIGLDRVEAILDAAHALSLQCRRNLAVKKLSDAAAREAAIEAAKPRVDPFHRIHRPQEHEEPDLRRSPLEPEEDLLLFIRDHNRYLAEWERDLLTIVHEQSQYFIPQIETKIMNEGWASYWHKRILDSLELDTDLQLEFIVRHNQVVRPHEGSINPYHLGLRVWEDLHRRAGGGAEGDAAIFVVRESDRDTAFLRRHLTEELIRDLDLFQYQRKGNEYVITEVADADGWRDIRDTLVASVGMNGVPVIRVVDGDVGGKRTLALEHVHDGRDLHPEYAERTLAFVHQLWQREVTLDTVIGGKRQVLVHNDRGFTVKSGK